MCLHVVVLSLRVSSFFPFFCFVLYCVGFVFTVFIFFSRFPSSASGGLEVAWSFTLCGSNFFCASFLRGVGIDFFHVRSTKLVPDSDVFKGSLGSFDDNSSFNLNFTGILLELNAKRWVDLLSCGLFIIIYYELNCV